jgi:hypothetical protein
MKRLKRESYNFEIFLVTGFFVNFVLILKFYKYFNPLFFMRAIYFERTAEFAPHVHACSSVRGIYIPDEKLVLYREKRGRFGGFTFSFTDRKEFLDEMRPLLDGTTPNVEGVSYSGIKGFEYDEARLRELIQIVKLERDLRNKVQSGISALLEEVER